MSLLKESEREFLTALSKLTYCNPFLPERIELEHEMLGQANRNVPSVWSFQEDSDEFFENAEVIADKGFKLVEELRERLTSGVEATKVELALYEDIVLYLMYDKYRADLNKLIVEFATKANHQQCGEAYQRYEDEMNHFVVGIPNPDFDLLNQPAHVWSIYFQIRRLFHNVFYWIVGSSVLAARLRADIWQSVLTHNMRRYARSVHQCMGDIPVLITGPSGTGKELVARAIAFSQYVPFDKRRGEFIVDYSKSLQTVHLAALSPTLIESEMFGHRKGAFTGASCDRKGLFEMCGQQGTVFLDEIGELGSEIQVKLLRVLQNRTFQRLGDLEELQFVGKVVAATNRDFAVEMQAGNFRQDLYYRLCADMIQTPSLADQLAEQPQDLRQLVTHLARSLAGDEHESLADEAVEWIDENLPADYSWPGNVRELEQCMRNIMIRGEYRPAGQTDKNVRTKIAKEIVSCSLTAEEVLERYCTLVYYQTGSYEESARRLKIDRRTVKSKVDESLLAKLRLI